MPGHAIPARKPRPGRESEECGRDKAQKKKKKRESESEIWRETHFLKKTNCNNENPRNRDPKSAKASQGGDGIDSAHDTLEDQKS